MRTMTSRILLAAGVAALIFAEEACYEDPAGLGESIMPQVELDEFDAQPQVAQSAGYSDAIREPYRSRIALNVDFAGDLSPHQTVTLNLDGTASEKITGGEVLIYLPTFAAMDEAGTDRVPSYPSGKELPVAARWDLPIMDGGAHWKQSLDIKLQEKGYYQVIVAVRAETLDDKDPFVVGEQDIEYWMLVEDGGGIVTRYLDPNRLPDGVAPEAGPFRERPQRAGQSAADGYVNADAGDDEIEFEVTYYKSGSYLKARWNVEVHFTYYDQVGEEIGGGYENLGSDGVAYAHCPNPYESLEVSVVVPSTSQITGRYTAGGTVVYDDDCGDTRNIVLSSYIYYPWMNLIDAVPDIESHFQQWRGPVKWTFVHQDSATVYWKSADRIQFGMTWATLRFAAAHEFGHAFHHHALGGIKDADCSDHQIDKGSSYRCAFSEGFADYAGYLGSPYSHYWENKSYYDSPHDRGEIEGNFAALIHDIIDSSNEAADETTYPASYVADVIETCTADGADGDDVSDFVWCLENRIDDNKHTDSFSREGLPPDEVSEDATEPSGWDADHIRTTWVKNVG